MQFKVQNHKIYMIKKYFTYGHKNNSNDQKNCSNEALISLNEQITIKFKLTKTYPSIEQKIIQMSSKDSSNEQKKILRSFELCIFVHLNYVFLFIRTMFFAHLNYNWDSQSIRFLDPPPPLHGLNLNYFQQIISSLG